MKNYTTWLLHRGDHALIGKYDTRFSYLGDEQLQNPEHIKTGACISAAWALQVLKFRLHTILNHKVCLSINGPKDAAVLAAPALALPLMMHGMRLVSLRKVNKTAYLNSDINSSRSDCSSPQVHREVVQSSNTSNNIQSILWLWLMSYRMCWIPLHQPFHSE